MTRQVTVTITLPDDEALNDYTDPVEFIYDALERYVGSIVDVYLLPVEEGEPVEHAVLIEERR